MWEKMLDSWNKSIIAIQICRIWIIQWDFRLKLSFRTTEPSAAISKMRNNNSGRAEIE